MFTVLLDIYAVKIKKVFEPIFQGQPNTYEYYISFKHLQNCLLA
jgi:hypothetical protein